MPDALFALLTFHDQERTPRLRWHAFIRVLCMLLISAVGVGCLGEVLLRRPRHPSPSERTRFASSAHRQRTVSFAMLSPATRREVQMRDHFRLAVSYCFGIMPCVAVGMISKVRHRQTRVEYALKTIQLEKLNSKLTKEIRNEIEILKRLDHPNIIREFCAWQSAGIGSGERGCAGGASACCYCAVTGSERKRSDRSEKHVFRSRLFCLATHRGE